jgi:hypothetical protein|tara:strand:+ start:88 stop:351 length:264 start_codon:yes stop_codon:yes gene_type:complete
MKLYRVQVKYKNMYIDETLEADNDKAALEYLVKKVDSGDVIEKQGAGFENPNLLFITLEEINRNATKVNIGETSVGVQVGNTSVSTG